MARLSFWLFFLYFNDCLTNKDFFKHFYIRISMFDLTCSIPESHDGSRPFAYRQND